MFTGEVQELFAHNPPPFFILLSGVLLTVLLTPLLAVKRGIAVQTTRPENREGALRARQSQRGLDLGNIGFLHLARSLLAVHFSPWSALARNKKKRASNGGL